MPSWANELLLIPVGFLAGVINTIAGGGSFISLPALMFVAGLPPQIANGTNRVAILTSNFTATRTFSKAGHGDRQLTRRIAVPVLLGVLLGAMLAVRLDPQLFSKIFGGLFLVMAVVLWRKPKLLMEANRVAIESRWAELLTCFVMGIYVGFIQAGMGLLMLLAIGLFHARDLVNANAVKNAVGLIVTAAALAVFAWYDQVAWRPGLIMAVGNVGGGIFGAKIAMKRGERLVFLLLVAVMVATGLKLLLS